MEVNNMKAMRETLHDISNTCAWVADNCNDVTGQTQRYMHDIVDKVKAALKEPPRQCDVGTDAEQSQRMADFCKRHYKKAAPGRHICSACKFHNGDTGLDCYFSWSQMPYESEVK